MSNHSLAPNGRRYSIPGEQEIEAQLGQIRAAASEYQALGRQMVVVQGLGFVGAAVAAAISDARSASGEPLYFVIGIDRPQPASYWKIAAINEGIAPVRSPDEHLDALTRAAVLERKNLRATASDEAIELADVIVVDVSLDVVRTSGSSSTEIEPDLAGFSEAVRSIGRYMRADALVVIETTVPIGVSRRVVMPLLEAERTKRRIEAPLRLAHAYERVMPGPSYIDSIRRHWRTVSAEDPDSLSRARAFLESFICTEQFPIRELASLEASELAKLLENTYRAVNIAFIEEWTRLAEAAGVDLFRVIDSIRVRKGTHDNMRYPGFGVGGYCLPKDPLLAQWSATELFRDVPPLELSLRALRINHDMPLHTLQMIVELAGGDLQGQTIAVCGVSYLPGVDDTRNSPTALLVDELLKRGAELRVHDPVVRRWEERSEIELSPSLSECLEGADGVVFAVAHHAYRDLSAEAFLALAPSLPFVIDAQNVICDATAAELRDHGFRLLGVGKGHWRRAGYELPVQP